MPLCPACDAPLGDGARACLACGTPARFSFNKAKGGAAQATRALEGARKDTGLARATGVDAPTAERLLDKADAANRERRPAHALAYAQAARRAVTIAKTRARLQADLSKAQEAVQTAKQGGSDATAAEKALDEAAKRVAAGELRAADTWLRKASVRAQEERRAKSQQTLVKSVEKAIKYAKERGADVTAAQEALAKAREALRAKAFDAARDAAAQAKEAADNARKFARYAKIVDGAEHAIELARKSGADLAEARHLLAEARKALKASLFAEAQAKAKATKEAVAEAKRYRAAELLVERAEKATIREERRGTDMASPAGILGAARTALEAREYRRVRDSVRDARDAIRDAIITRRLQGTLGQLTTDIAELKMIGADPMEAETFLAEATAALEVRDFEKCRRLAARCRRAADDARDARRQEIVIDTVQTIVHAAAGSGAVDPGQIRSLIEDVESMLASGEAVDVDSLVKARLTLGDATRLKDLTKRLGNVRFGLLELKRGDIDVANSEEIIANAIGALDAGRYDEAEPPIAELEELTGQLMEFLRATAADTIAKAKAAVQRAQEANIEVPDAARVLASAEQALADDKVYEALEFGRIAQVRADSAWKKHFEEESKRDVEAMRSVADRVRRARERTDRLAANLEYLAGIGVDAAAARDSLNRAHQALEAKRIEEAESHLEATERIVEGLRSELRQKAEEALAQLKRNVLEARAQSLMTPEMEAVLLRAEEAVRAEHYHEAIESIRALDETIEHAKEERAAEVQRKEMERAKKASERFVRVRRMIEELRRANIDIQGADEALLAAEKALQTRDFERVDALLLDLEETAREMRAELVAAARFILSKARESVEAAEQAGIDVADAHVLIQNAQGFLEKGKLDDAVEAANTAKQRADTALRLKSEEEARAERMRLETARQKIDRLRVTLDDLHRADIGVEGADDALTQAEQALAEKRYQDVHNILADTEAIAETLREGLRVAAADLIEKSRQNVEVAKKTGLDLRRADMVLANAADAIREGRYVEAIEYHKVIDDIVEDSKRLRRFRALEAEVQVLRAELLRAASLGGDTNATEDLLKRAQEEVALGRYDRVAEYTEQVRLSLEAIRRQVLETKLDRARVAIGKAQMLGADPTEAETLFPQAEKAANEGNYEVVDLLVKTIEAKAAEASKATMAVKAEHDFLALEDLAKQAEAAGVTIPEAKKFLDEARRLRDERNFDSLSQVVAEARRLFEETSRDRILRAHRERMRGLSAMLETAKRIGANVDEAERILSQAEQAIESNDLSLADVLVKQAEVSTGMQIQSYIQNKYPNLVLKMPTGGLQANQWNKYILEVANKGAIAARNIDLKIEGDVEVQGLRPIEELGADETAAMEIGVKPTREGEVPINVRIFYQRYFDENRYEAADEKALRVERPGTYLVEDVFLIHRDGRLIAHESRKFRQEIDEDIFSGMLTVVQDFIKDSFKQRTQTGLKRLDFGASKILIERSPHCFLASVVIGSEPALLPLYMAEVLREIEAKYGETLQGWSGLLHELPGIDEVIQKLVLVTQVKTADRGALAQSEVAELQRAIEVAQERGAETSEVEQLLAQAEDSLQTDMELAFQILSRAKVEVKESEEKHVDRMKRLLQQTAEAVNQMRSLGIDAGPSEIMLKDAREAFQQGRFDRLQEIADNVRGSLERVQQDSMAKRVESELNGLIGEIERVRGEGVDVTRAEAFLVKIEDALQRRNFREVEDHIARARDALQGARKKAILKRSQAEIERLTAMLVEAKTFGAEAKEAEALLLRAREALAEGRADDLDALVKQAGAVAKRRMQEFLEDRYPRLFLAMPSGGLQAEAWNRFVLEVANKGNVAAKDVQVRLMGDVEVRGLQAIPKIDANEKKRIELGVRPRAAGPVPIDVELTYLRPLDDRQYETTDSREVRVERPGTYLVEDAFLIHRDGRLIVHETRRFRDSMDEDIFSGMLTAVLNFVKQSMQDRAGTGLKRLDFGQSKILFERSPNVYLAATVTGGEPVVLPIYMVEILREVEERYGRNLEKWTGFLTELDGVQELVRRLLFVTERPDADLGPLEEAPITEALQIVAGEGDSPEGADFLQEARAVIESRDFAEASAFLKARIESFRAGREELHAQLREAVIAHGEATGLDVTDDQMRTYIDLVRRVVEGIFIAREKAGIDRVWPVKRVAVKVEDADALDVVTSFRKIIVNQCRAKELDIVPPGQTWRGLKLNIQLDTESITKAYRIWAKKIEILLRSQDAWKIKAGLDRGEYNLGVEGQKIRIDPSMVWFTETVPDNVIEQKFEGGTVYVDTEMNEDILAEGYARELVSIIREARGDLKLPAAVWIETKIHASETLNRLLKKWKDFITHETNSQVVRFVRGDIADGYIVECSLGPETFTVGVKPAEGTDVTP